MRRGSLTLLHLLAMCLPEMAIFEVDVSVNVCLSSQSSIRHLPYKKGGITGQGSHYSGTQSPGLLVPDSAPTATSKQEPSLRSRSGSTHNVGVGWRGVGSAYPFWLPGHDGPSEMWLSSSVAR